MQLMFGFQCVRGIDFAILDIFSFFFGIELKTKKSAAGFRRIPSEPQFIRRKTDLYVGFRRIFFSFFFWHFSIVLRDFSGFPQVFCFSGFSSCVLVLFSGQAAPQIILYVNWHYRWRLQVPPPALFGLFFRKRSLYISLYVTKLIYFCLQKSLES